MKDRLETVIELLGETPMPELVMVMNGFLANPSIEKAPVIKRINEGIEDMGKSFSVLSYLHNFMDYQKAHEFLRPPYGLGEHRPYVRDELPRNKVYSLARRFFSHIEDFKFYLQQFSQSSETDKYRATETVIYTPQGVDFCLIDCLLAIDRVGLVRNPHWTYEEFEAFSEIFQQNVNLPFENERNKKLFFWYERSPGVYCRCRMDEVNKIDISDHDNKYPCLKAYRKLAKKILANLEEKNSGGRE